VELILVHGALGCASQLAYLQESLGSTHTTRVVELEGHGSTRAPSDRYSMQRFAANIDASITARAAIFGYSMGGYAALLLAAQRPERVASVVTLGTKFAWTSEVAAKETSRLDPATIRVKVPAFADQQEQRHRGAGGWESVMKKTAALIKELGDHPLVDDALLANITQPVRLMVGDRDAMVSVDETASCSRKLVQGQLAVLPGTPHPIEQVRPALLSSMILDFLR
jgi:pimeloyl-ACP methyl ester carboxylesterase